MEKAISLEGVSVFIGMPAHRPVPVPTVLSLTATMGVCTRMGIRINVAIPYAASVVTSARNHVAHLFLQSKYDYLFWIDSDMRWRVEDFLKTLATATLHDVVRVAYPARQDPPCFDVDGLGFTCVSRKVMQALAEKRPVIFYGDHAPCREIFYESKRKSLVADEAGSEYEFMAEDTNFYHDVRQLGFKTWLDPDIVLGHVGEKVYEGAFKDDEIYKASVSGNVVNKVGEHGDDSGEVSPGSGQAEIEGKSSGGNGQVESGHHVEDLEVPSDPACDGHPV